MEETPCPNNVLPDLDYDYAALEPYISRQVLSLHHVGHHATYVENANLTLRRLDAARDGGDFTQIAWLEKALAFNISGHVLHSLFWCNLSPRGGGKPDGDLAVALACDFGSFERFRA